MEQVDSIVIGAGVVGLAIARARALAGREVIILEKEALIGSGISARNSEVIHAGIYYPAGSLKARLCVRGREMLYDFCGNYNVPHQKCGKLIVASNDSQLDQLGDIAARAARNGVPGMRKLSRAETLEREAALEVHGSLLSPETGIVDSHALMLACLGDAETHGAMLALDTPVTSVGPAENGRLRVETGGDAAMTVAAREVINAAGLTAPEIAASFPAGGPAPDRWYAKGNYFSLSGRAPFHHLIYPVPEPGGLGVHLTLDLGGQAKFGPDVEWLDVTSPDEIDYTVDPARADRFYSAIRAYWPGLPDNSLQADYSGVRPKISPPGAPAADFRIEGPVDHGVEGLVHLFGIESPGLTSSLAIAEHVSRLLD